VGGLEEEILVVGAEGAAEADIVVLYGTVKTGNGLDGVAESGSCLETFGLRCFKSSEECRWYADSSEWGKAPTGRFLVQPYQIILLMDFFVSYLYKEPLVNDVQTPNDKFNQWPAKSISLSNRL